MKNTSDTITCYKCWQSRAYIIMSQLHILFQVPNIVPVNCVDYSLTHWLPNLPTTPSGYKNTNGVCNHTWPYLFNLGSDISPAKGIRVPNWTLFLSSDKS